MTKQLKLMTEAGEIYRMELDGYYVADRELEGVKFTFTLNPPRTGIVVAYEDESLLAGFTEAQRQEWLGQARAYAEQCDFFEAPDGSDAWIALLDEEDEPVILKDLPAAINAEPGGDPGGDPETDPEAELDEEGFERWDNHPGYTIRTLEEMLKPHGLTLAVREPGDGELYFKIEVDTASFASRWFVMFVEAAETGSVKRGWIEISESEFNRLEPHWENLNKGVVPPEIEPLVDELYDQRYQQKPLALTQPQEDAIRIDHFVEIAIL